MIVLTGSSKAITTGVMLAIARIAGETAPLLFTSLGNRFWQSGLDQPISFHVHFQYTLPSNSSELLTYSYIIKRVTIFIVAHNMQQAARISDQTAFFLMGEPVALGDTSTIFTTPKEQRTERSITGRFG